MTDHTIPKRQELAPAHTWNAESVFPSVKEWEAELKAIQAELPVFTQRKGGLKEGPQALSEILQARDELLQRADIAFMYANMTHAVETTDQTAAEMSGKARGVFGQVRAAVSFVEPELLEVGLDTIQKWLLRKPSLASYTHYFDDLFRKRAHIRSTEVEELLGMLVDPFSSVSTTAGMLTDADFKFPPAAGSDGDELEVTQGNFVKIMTLPDRELRRTAWENYMDTHLAYKNTLSSNLATSIKQNTFAARARRHTTTLEASLAEYNIPVQVFHNLIETFRANLPVWHRYFAIRRKSLGVEQLEPYDIWAPLTSQQPNIPYKQAVDWICRGLAPMGEAYVDPIRQGCFEERWVDIYPNQGKSAGAFSYGSYGTHPFIVMSYGDTMLSLSTLAHELGHSMHSYLSWIEQPYIYGDYSLFVAEVASNFHQAMVRAYLLEAENDPDFQISLIEEAMSNFYRYFLVMPTLARFELETHQRVERGEGLSAAGMNELMADLYQESFGDQVHIDRQRVGINWATFGHLYADYYVYQYATGISGANALSRRILSGVPGAVEDYLSFLKAGSSMYPLEALKLAGVDLTSPEPVEQTFGVMAGMVDRLEELLNSK